MLDKIKTLKEILLPDAIKLDIPIDEYIETYTEEERLEIFLEQLKNISNHGGLSWRRRVIQTFGSYEKIIAICKSKYSLELTIEMYDLYNKSICINTFEKMRNDIKLHWKKHPDYVYDFPKKWGEGDGGDDELRWNKVIESFNSIEEIKKHSNLHATFDTFKNQKEFPEYGALYQQNLIAYFTQYHAKKLLWSKIEELKLEVPKQPKIYAKK